MCNTNNSNTYTSMHVRSIFYCKVNACIFSHDAVVLTDARSMKYGKISYIANSIVFCSLGWFTTDSGKTLHMYKLSYVLNEGVTQTTSSFHCFVWDGKYCLRRRRFGYLKTNICHRGCNLIHIVTCCKSYFILYFDPRLYSPECFSLYS